MIKELKRSDWQDRLIKVIASTPNGKEIVEEWIEERLVIEEACRRC